MINKIEADVPKIKVHTPKSFSEFMGVVEGFQAAREFSWYRGVGKPTHCLLPSLFRHPKKKKIEEIQILENELEAVFEQRSPPFISQIFNSEWERMFFMQHYGIPTRLLDWSESPFVALYFALTSCERTSSGKPKNDAVFWMLDPKGWNRDALSDISYDGDILNPNQEQVKSYSPRRDLVDRKSLPVMIYGTHNSARIVAQRGVFSLFGKNVLSIEDEYEGGKFSSGILEKAIISKDCRDSVALSLFRKGILDSTVYPDLHGLSLELKRSFGFFQ